MRHIGQVAFFYRLKTDCGIRHYECFSVTEAIRLANQDGFIVLDVLSVDTDAEDIDNFCVYGHKGD